MVSDRARKLGEAMVAIKILTAEQLKKAVEDATKEGSPSLIVGLLEAGLLNFKIFEKFVSSTMGIQSAIVSNRPYSKEAVELVTMEHMTAHLIYPFGLREEQGKRTIALGMVDPTDQDVIDFLQKKTNCRIVPVLISLPDYKEAMKANFHRNQLDIGTAQKEEFVVLRAGGHEEEIQPPGTLSTQGQGTVDTNFQTAKTVQPKPGWDLKTFQVNPQAANLSGIEFFGKNNKKFREEILAKLDLDPSDAQQLREPNYTRDILAAHLKNITAPKLQKIFNSLPLELRIEALMNVVVKAGLVSKHDLLVSAAVSLAFYEGKEGKEKP